MGEIVRELRELPYTFVQPAQHGIEGMSGILEFIRQAFDWNAMAHVVGGDQCGHLAETPQGQKPALRRESCAQRDQ